MKWFLNRQGVIGRPPADTVGLDAGIAFHEHMVYYWKQPTWTVGNEGIVGRAIDWVHTHERETLLEQGLIGTEVNLGGDPMEAAKHGRYPGTCDLLTENGAGLTVTDYKTKYRMEAQYADRELRQTQRSWQLRQYAWFVQEKYQRPVTKIRKLLVAFTPSLKAWLADYPVIQEELVSWHNQAQQVWSYMDHMDPLSHAWLSGEEPWDLAYRNPDACERYGWNWRCEFYENCWDGKEIEYAFRDTDR